MKLFVVEGNRQRLDGGAMFGNAPKELWQRWQPADEKNRIDLACRGLLLINDKDEVILFETGIGNAYDEKFRERFGIYEPHHVLLKNLQNLKIAPEDVDKVVLSHLHFDHAGGLLKNDDGVYNLAFPNADIYVGEQHWQRALYPHFRDRASFLPHLHSLLENSGKLHLVNENQKTNLYPEVDFWFSHGHTLGLMHAWIDLGQNKKLFFASDLIPGQAWIHLPITMGYDRFPERLIEEKEKILNQIYDEGHYLYMTHDYQSACVRVLKDDKGRFYGEEDLSLFVNN